MCCAVGHFFERMQLPPLRASVIGAVRSAAKELLKREDAYVPAELFGEADADHADQVEVAHGVYPIEAYFW